MGGTYKNRNGTSYFTLTTTRAPGPTMIDGDTNVALKMFDLFYKGDYEDVPLSDDAPIDRGKSFIKALSIQKFQLTMEKELNNQGFIDLIIRTVFAVKVFGMVNYIKYCTPRLKLDFFHDLADNRQFADSNHIGLHNTHLNESINNPIPSAILFEGQPSSFN